jgi:heptosyltransferase III
VNILILHPGALGDIILSLPAVLLLREHFPAAQISLAGNLDHLSVAFPRYAHRLISLSNLPLHRLYSGEALREDDRRFWNSFDRIVSWTGHGSPEITQKFAQLKAGVCCAPWRPGAGETRHVSRIFADSLNPWVPLQAALPEAGISVPEQSREDARKWLDAKGWKGGAIIALHPGAGGSAKRWSLDSFRNLTRLIFSQSSFKLLIVEGPAETGLGTELGAHLPGSRTMIAPQLPLPLLSGILAHCTAYAGNDSGVAHLAAGLGIATVVLFGPTSPQQWVPSGRRVSALRRNQGCKACAAGSGQGHSCLKSILPGDVWGEIQKLQKNPL